MAVDLSRLAGPSPDPEIEEQAMQEIPVDEELAEYVFLLGVDMLKEGGGIQVLQKAVQQSADPIVIIAQFVVQMVSQLSEVLSQETNFDPRVMLARDGFVDSITEYLTKQLKLDPEAADMIEQEVLDMMKGLAQGEGKPQPEPEQPPMEQMAGPQGPPPQQGPGIDSMGGGMQV